MKHDKVLFLDIDGVLNTPADFFEVEHSGHPVNTVKGGRVLNRSRLSMLQHIVDQTDATVVVSSTWRLKFEIDDILDMFSAHGCNIPVMYRTPQLENLRYAKAARGKEIKKYLDDNEVDKFVILDDWDDNILECGFIKADIDEWTIEDENFIHTDPEHGLRVVEMYRAINILGLNEQAQQQRKKLEDALNIFGVF